MVAPVDAELSLAAGSRLVTLGAGEPGGGGAVEEPPPPLQDTRNIVNRASIFHLSAALIIYSHRVHSFKEFVVSGEAIGVDSSFSSSRTCQDTLPTILECRKCSLAESSPIYLAIEDLVLRARIEFNGFARRRGLRHKA